MADMAAEPGVGVGANSWRCARCRLKRVNAGRVKEHELQEILLVMYLSLS